MASMNVVQFKDENPIFQEEKRIPVGGRNIILTGSFFKGFRRIHLRFFQNHRHTGKLYPTLRGITLSWEEFQDIKAAVIRMDNYFNLGVNKPIPDDFYVDDKVLEECLKNTAGYAEEMANKNFTGGLKCLLRESSGFDSQSVKSRCLIDSFN